MNEPIYLDNAATSFPKAPGVPDAVLEQLTCPSGSAFRGTHATAQRATTLLSQTRLAVARRLGSQHPNQWSFFLNATDALNAAIKGVLTPGDHAITSHLAHKSVLRPLTGLKTRLGIDLTLVPVTHEGRIVPDAMLAACRPETKLIVLTLVSNVAGGRQPVEPIIQAARARGILTLVDASQAAGECLCNVDELSADMVALPGHKGLLGPQGVGLLYTRPSLRIEAWREGGSGTDSPMLSHPSDMPTHLEAGTHNLPGIAGLLAALKWFEENEAEADANHKQQLSVLHQALHSLEGCTVYGPPPTEAACGPISFNLTGWSPSDAANVLDSSFGIVVRAGLHCAPLIHADIGAPQDGTLRASPGPFTHDSEIARFLTALKALLGK